MTVIFPTRNIYRNLSTEKRTPLGTFASYIYAACSARRSPCPEYVLIFHRDIFIVESLHEVRPSKHHRASARLKGHDYSFPGAYFITLVAFQREMLFGEIVNGEMILNPRGEIIQEEWFASTAIRKEIRLFPEEFVVMPNHIHGIVWIGAVPDHGIF